jgi:hypothetical protein
LVKNPWFEPCSEYANTSKIGEIDDSISSVRELQAKTKIWKWVCCQYFHMVKIPGLLRLSISFANVRDHRWLPVARLVPGEERAQAEGVTRVAIR